MDFAHGVALFFGGLFLANFLPHAVAGGSGTRFPTPFARPPFRGLSSPVVNTLYALLNLAAGYALLVLVGELQPRSLVQVAIAASGFGLWSLQMARAVTKLRAKAAQGQCSCI